MKWLLLFIMVLAILIARASSLEGEIKNEQIQINQIRQENNRLQKSLEEKIKEATRSANLNHNNWTLPNNNNQRTTGKISQELSTIKDYIRKLFGSHSDEAFKIINCESGFQPTAVGNGSNYGLFQINSIHIRRFGALFTMDTMANIEVAHQIYLEQGWNPWSCRRVLG